MRSENLYHPTNKAGPLNLTSPSKTVPPVTDFFPNILDDQEAVAVKSLPQEEQHYQQQFYFETVYYDRLKCGKHQDANYW